jgi:hypothetical protein
MSPSWIPEGSAQEGLAAVWLVTVPLVTMVTFTATVALAVELTNAYWFELSRANAW